MTAARNLGTLALKDISSTVVEALKVRLSDENWYVCSWARSSLCEIHDKINEVARPTTRASKRLRRGP